MRPTMRKRGATHSGQRGHVLTPGQVQTLVMPIHVAAELLPLGLFSEAHAHDLAAFLSVAQFAADEACREDVHDSAHRGAEILCAMRDRAQKCGRWNVTTEERQALHASILTIDKWMRGVSSTRWARALHRVLAICNKLEAEGRTPLESIDVRRQHA